MQRRPFHLARGKQVVQPVNSIVHSDLSVPMEPEHTQPLSVVVLAHNEEQDLERCIRSLTWADDILVIDDCSTDETAAIARHYGRVVQRRLDAFDAQRNFALTLVRHDWVLFVDADEVVSPTLADEIKRELAAARADAYAVVRRAWFLGRAMRFGGWKPEPIVRLGLRHLGRWVNPVHEKWQFETESACLKTPLDHHTDWRYADRLTKSNLYSTLLAEQRSAAGAKFRWWSLLALPAWRAIKSYVIKQGFREGMHGAVWAGHVAIAEFALQVKLWELEARARRSCEIR